jgi:hypothetical protein
VLTLSEGSLQRAGEVAHVWRLQGNQVKKVAVKLGERDARTGELPVLDGLTAGDRILRRPGSGLVDGQSAELAPANAAASAAAPAKPAASAKP